MAACSGGHAQPSADADTSAIPSLKVSAAEIAQLKKDGKTFQYSLAKDGVVTFAEYQRLAEAYMQCVGDAGGKPIADSNVLDAANNYEFAYELDSPAIQSAARGCDAKYRVPLTDDWSLEHKPPASLISKADDALGQCLRDHGLDFPYQHPTVDDFHKVNTPGKPPPQAFLDCTEQVGKQVNLPGFAGG